MSSRRYTTLHVVHLTGIDNGAPHRLLRFSCFQQNITPNDGFQLPATKVSSQNYLGEERSVPIAPQIAIPVSRDSFEPRRIARLTLKRCNAIHAKKTKFERFPDFSLNVPEYHCNYPLLRSIYLLNSKHFS